MVKRSLTTLVAMAVVCSLFPTTTSAQVVYGKPASIGTRFVYNQWDIGDGDGVSTIKQSVAPLTAFLPIRDNLEALLYVAGSSNDFSRGSSKNSLSGSSDVRFQINQSLLGDHLVISGGLNLPVGKRRLNYEVDTTIINLLSENYVSLPMRRFGQGFGVSATVGAATMLGSYKAGIGVSYEFTGSYEPYAEKGDYNPGNMATVTAGIDRSTRQTAFVADVVVTLYTVDYFKDLKAFKQSPQVAVRVGAVRRTGQFRVDWNVRYLLRGRNTEYEANQTISRQLQLYGDEFVAGGSVRWYFNPGWYVSPSAGVKYIGGNEEGLGSSRVLNFGGTLGHSFGRGVSVSVGAKYFVGEADGVSINVEGVQLSAGLTTTF